MKNKSFLKNYHKGINLVGVLFLFNIMTLAKAQTNIASTRILVSWSNKENILFTYTLEAQSSNHINIRLETSDKITNNVIVQFVGGFDKLFQTKNAVLTELKAKSVSAESPQTVSSFRKLNITFLSPAAVHSSSVQGDAKDLNKFFHSTSALKRVLRLSSENQPKAYRLINEAGNSKAIIRLPAGWVSD